MKERTKLTLVVSVGTVVIELSLFLILWFALLKMLSIVVAFEQQIGTSEKGVLVVSMLAGMVLLFGVYNKASDYLRSRMCWALVRHFHGKE